jgi:hypothetical protein
LEDDMHRVAGNELGQAWKSRGLLREDLGLPPLSRAKEAFRAHLITKLSGAHYPIRNEEDLRRAFGPCVWSDKLVELIVPQDYLFTNARQLANMLAERAAALWDLAARAREQRGCERRERRALYQRLARSQKQAGPGRQKGLPPRPTVH